ncbi:hypothetical protein JR053_03490 [Wolbachia endosymbiont of Nasonia vitripennis]|uniref:Uncharacterized protein n=2 Tax=Wolbachia TaxID=953 RepID=A0AAU8MJU5_9RICK|nr:MULTISPECIES: hypothetical protein [unclassified Wolbachia]TNK94248.1 hypothetical protein OUY_02740 [Wolbachia endosymbiont of Leptopilina clavipes]UXX39803.1 hypothetical protein MJ631_04685 [Wolbachia endosymbiont of Oryzaephilus surinamensis]
MLETLKKWGIDLTLKVKDLFSSSESQVYVKDLRKVMIYEDGRKCQYPKNYDQIVDSGRVVKKNDKLVKDKDGNPEYQLIYNEYKFDLALVKEIDKKSYFTIDFLVSKGRREVNDYSKFYKPFKFSKIDLEKHLPVFEVDTKLLRLTNSSFLAKKGCFINDDTGEVDEKDRDEKGRNGKLLYASDYKKLSTHFSEIRDQDGNLELDKSLISVSIVFATSLAKVCTKLLTSLPIKLGEYLISEQNPIAKSFGYLLFTPAMAVKNLVNMGATILKAPILLFVANEKKYGDAYLTMWKHQLKECWKEVKSDFNVVTNGERPKPKQKDHKPLSIAGTWKELNARKSDIEKNLEKGLSKNSESIDKSRELGVGESLKEKLQNKTDEKVAAAVNQKSNTPHIDREIERRQDSSRNVGTPSRS